MKQMIKLILRLLVIMGAGGWLHYWGQARGKLGVSGYRPPVEWALVLGGWLMLGVVVIIAILIVRVIIIYFKRFLSR